MRFKAIPMAAVKIATAHPLLIGGAAAVAAIGGYKYYSGTISTSSGDSDIEPDPMASTQAGYSYGLPMVLPFGGSAGGGSAGGVVDTISGASGGGVSNSDLFNLELLKENHDYDLANKSLDAQLAIAATNAQIALAGIQASNYQTSAQLANSFLMSGSQFAAGNIAGMTFAFLSSGPTQSSKKKKKNKQIQQNFNNFTSLLNNSTVQALLGMNNVQSSTGSVTNATGSGTTSTNTGSTSGSTSTTSTLSNTSTSSTSTSTNTSGGETAFYGGGGGGGRSFNTAIQ